jgi:hypothetical protein
MYAKGGLPSGTSRSLSRSVTNDTGSTLLKATAVRLTSTGVSTIDVSNEASANAIAGLMKANIANAQVGDVINTGIIDDVTTSASIGDIMYISKSGGLTNIKPSDGVNSFSSGDWVIRVGVIAKNSDNFALKDLMVNIQIVGQL